MSAETTMTIIVFFWGVGTTIAGLWFSYQNNYKQNTRIIEVLESINHRIGGTELAHFDSLIKQDIVPNKEEPKEFVIRIPNFFAKGGKRNDNKQ